MRRLLSLAAVLTLCLWQPATAQQVSDPAADLSVAAPAFTLGQGPRLVLDDGHHNFHTAQGRFAPFAAVMRNDGFVVEGSGGPLTAASLSGVRVLVVANALNPENDGRWSLPTPSAFTPEEIALIRAWVEDGGSLLLIADHMPFAGAAQDLAGAFGFEFYNGFAQRKPPGGQDIFRLIDGSLKADVVTRGRNPGETVSKVRTFTGSAFSLPPQARPILVFPKGYRSLEPDVAWEFGASTPSRDIAGAAQGAVMTAGKGRIAVFGEAAMFTAQLSGPTARPMGFNANGAEQNKQLMLNVMHWLAGELPAQ
jgi:hypothetical protein